MWLPGRQVTGRNKEAQALTGEKNASAHRVHRVGAQAEAREVGTSRTEAVVLWQEHRLWNKINLGASLALSLQSVSRLLRISESSFGKDLRKACFTGWMWG